MLILEGVATDQVSNDDPSLPFFVVFKADNNHAMASQATAPAIVAILLADLRRCHELEVAICADIVVAVIALRAMVPSH